MLLTRIHSPELHRYVRCDLYLPPGYVADTGRTYPFVLFNDGQDLPRMGFARLLNKLYAENALPPIVAVGLHASKNRLREYGTAQRADYKGRGDLAPAYSRFVLETLLPWLRKRYRLSTRASDATFAGFSLGGLSAIDLVWANPEVFGAAGVFSGSLWWRSTEVCPNDPDADRIMHDIVQQADRTAAGQRFWFQCGTLDETEDRNQNGIIDSIDDTLDLIRALREKGTAEQDIRYLEIEGGTHEPATWAVAMPDFLGWVFARASRC